MLIFSPPHSFDALQGNHSLQLIGRTFGRYVQNAINVLISTFDGRGNAVERNILYVRPSNDSD